MSGCVTTGEVLGFELDPKVFLWVAVKLRVDSPLFV